MGPAQPVANLLVVRSPDIVGAVEFYKVLGMLFTRHSHGAGPEHYSSSFHRFVFEIYPSRNETDATNATRFGFTIDDVDEMIGSLERIGATIVSAPADSEWGRRAVVRDFDGHTIELLTPTS